MQPLLHLRDFLIRCRFLIFWLEMYIMVLENLIIFLVVGVMDPKQFYPDLALPLISDPDTDLGPVCCQKGVVFVLS